jgi:hypothetical protein
MGYSTSGNGFSTDGWLESLKDRGIPPNGKVKIEYTDGWKNYTKVGGRVLRKGSATLRDKRMVVN